jgi:hypothetical protein
MAAYSNPYAQGGMTPQQAAMMQQQAQMGGMGGMGGMQQQGGITPQQAAMMQQQQQQQQQQQPMGGIGQQPGMAQAVAVPVGAADKVVTLPDGERRSSNLPIISLKKIMILYLKGAPRAVCERALRSECAKMDPYHFACVFLAKSLRATGTKLAITEVGTAMIVIGPAGQQMKMKPSPQWVNSAHAAGGGGGAPPKTHQAMVSKRSYTPMVVTGSGVWQTRSLALDATTLKYGETAGAEAKVSATTGASVSLQGTAWMWPCGLLIEP